MRTQKCGNRAILSLMATKKTIPKTVAAKKPAKRSAAPAPVKKVGRPRAKHSDPDYVQMSIYISREVRAKVKMRLLATEGEFSGLVESLLGEWLKTQ
jgi:hypothetical protein